ncbi:MAG: DUF3094 family protein [Porticoccaceae bacterium]|nr:DUF3094 family protein [Porticoccaceae bacterium]
MTADKPENRLSEEDLKRVEEYLSGPVQKVDRKPFRPLLLLFWLWVVVTLLGLVSLLFGRIEGYL